MTKDEEYYSLDAIVRCEETLNLHARPAATVSSIAQLFPNTVIKIVREHSNKIRVVNAHLIMELLLAMISNGEKIKIRTFGEHKHFAGDCMKIALENLRPVSLPGDVNESSRSVQETVYEKVDYYFRALNNSKAESFRQNAMQQLMPENIAFTIEATINDNFHQTTTPALVYAVSEYVCKTTLKFSTNGSKPHKITIDPRDKDAAFADILEIDPPPGTMFSISTLGKNRINAAHAIAAILNNLKECDSWLRQKGNTQDIDSVIVELIKFAKEFDAAKSGIAFSPPTYYMSDVMTEQGVLVFSKEMLYPKHEALRQLVNPHAAAYGLDYKKIYEAFLRQEEEMPLLLEYGLAMTHITLPQGPRVSFSLGVFPRGVNWIDGDDGSAKIVCMFVTATDTHRTYLNYNAQLMKILDFDSALVERIVNSNNSRDVITEIIATERRFDEAVNNIV